MCNENQVMLLHHALKNVLKAAGVLGEWAEPSGPELLVASEDYIEHMKKEKGGDTECCM